MPGIDPTAIPAGIPPDQYAQWLQAQRSAMLANALSGSSLSPIDQPQTAPVHGLYVQPRTGGAQVAAKLAEALLGRRATNQSIQQNAELMQAGNNYYAPSQQGQPQNPHNPWGLPADTVRRLALTDPVKYADYLQGPESVRLGRIAGTTDQAAAGGALTKATAIDVRPGSTILDPVSGDMMVGADPAKGEYYAVGKDGQVHAFPIKNDATIQAWNAGLKTASEQQNTPRTIDMGGGKTTVGYAPTPPALRGSAPQVPGVASPPPASVPGAAPAPPVAAPGAAPPANPVARPPAAAAPAQPGGPLWSTIPKLNVPTTPNSSSDARVMGQIANANARDKELTDQYGAASHLADQQLEYNRRAMTALPNAEVGPMSEWLTENRARLSEAFPALGKLLPESGSVTPTMELNKELLNSALQGARQIYGSRMTQNEVKLQTEEMSPSAHMTRDAIASLVQQGNIQAMYAKQQADDYSKFTQAGGDPTKFESWYSTHRPLTEFSAYTTMDPAKRATAMQRFQANPGTREQFKQALGFDPVNWQQ